METVNVSMNENGVEFEAATEINNNFYQKYYPQIRAIVSRILTRANQSGDIEDCVSVVFLDLMERLQQYNESRGSMGAFVTVIARSAALNYCKANSRKNSELIGDEKIDKLFYPIEYQNETEFDLLVESIVSRLNKDERVLFTMRYLYYYTSEEIARTLNIRRSAVDMRTNRLKNKIRKFLDRGGIII